MNEIMVVGGQVKRTRRAPGARDAERIAKALARAEAVADGIRGRAVDISVRALRKHAVRLSEIVEADNDQIRRMHRGELLLELETIIDRVENWYAMDPAVAEKILSEPDIGAVADDDDQDMVAE